MTPDIYLLIHNVISIVSAIATFGMAMFTFLNGKKQAANVAFALMLLAVDIFVISHVIGVNTVDPFLSRTVFMFNISVLFFGPFFFHTILAMIGKDHEKKWLLIFIYVSTIAISILFIIFPNLFLLPSVPKMYFPNYYNPGILNTLRLLSMYVLVIYAVRLLYVAFRDSKEEGKRKQYKSLMVITVLGYGVGNIPNLLVYDIQVDPLLGMPFAIIFAIPFIYAAIRYELFNIRVIAKQAFAYALAIGIVGGLITTLNYSSKWIQAIYPSFSSWITTLISAVLTVSIGYVIWQRLRESDLLKYEFLTTVSHKFRTPLTGIKWATENLSGMELPQGAKDQIEYIKNSNEKLVELTDLLVNTSSSANSTYKYNFTSNNISNEVEKVLASLTHQIQTRGTNIVKNIEPNIFAIYDVARVKFVIQTFIENAIHYTKAKGVILIDIKKVKNEVIFSVHDKGMGINAKDLPYIFIKFYRTAEARMADTEGMGIGLFISKEIIKHHKGRIWVESEGPDKGSTFYFSLPLEK